MKTPEEFRNAVRRKETRQRARRKTVRRRTAALTLAVCVTLAGGFLLREPLLGTGGSAGENAAATSWESALPEAPAEEETALEKYDGLFTLEAAPAKLVDAYGAIRVLEQETWQKIFDLAQENGASQAPLDEQERLQKELDEKAQALRREAEAAGQGNEKNELDPAFPAGVSALAGDLAPLLLGDGENGCVSPLSLTYALALAGTGAEGDTRQAFADVLRTEDLDAFAQQCGKYLRQHYRDSPAGSFRLENSLWLDDRAVFRQEFLNGASENFYTSAFRADFTDPALGDAVSQWIREQTNGLLRPQLEFDPTTVLALVNTLYFNAHWSDEFDPAGNTVEDFHPADGSPVPAEFMNRREDYGSVLTAEHYKAAALPLTDGVMIFLLPNEGVAAEDLLNDPQALADLCHADPERWNQETIPCRIDWSVPKFTVDSSFNLQKSLEALGLDIAFDPNRADFTAMGTSPLGNLALSQARQDTHVTVDEEGVEGAAFTLMTVEAMGAMGMPSEIVEMKLDRPFLFAILSRDLLERADESGPLDVANTPLFLGIVNQPSAAE